MVRGFLGLQGVSLCHYLQLCFSFLGSCYIQLDILTIHNLLLFHRNRKCSSMPLFGGKNGTRRACFSRAYSDGKLAKTSYSENAGMPAISCFLVRAAEVFDAAISGIVLS